MSISNTENTGSFLNLMRDIETGRDEPEPHQVPIESRIVASVIAAEIQRNALIADPETLASTLFHLAVDVPHRPTADLIQTGAALILQLLTERDHYQARVREMEKRFGAV